MPASVRLYGLHVGTLDVARDGRLSFIYSTEWLERNERDARHHPLSLSLPFREARYYHEDAGPFFDGLLPDNNKVREQLARHLHVDASDDFALLYELGADCPGAITILPQVASEIPEDRIPPQFHLMSERELADYIKDLPGRPLFVDADGELRLSLAGMHHKAAVLQVGTSLAVPKGRTPTTHIVKIDIEGLRDSLKVEHFCLEAARVLGLDTVRSYVKMADGVPFLLIARYDRAVGDRDGHRYIRRLHQEDFCQAMRRFPREKYEKDGGPGWVECFALLNRTVDPATSRTELLRRAIFQFLIGNPDAHAKNYSFVYKGDGIHLSKLYDVNNAAAFRSHYKEQRPRLAMLVGKERDPTKLTLAHWTQFARDVAITPAIVHEELSKMAKTLLQEVATVRSSLANTPADSPLLDLTVDDISQRCTAVMKW
ncbi:type II toxin-antitoxin system HipA family toxin (plasmid) [Rhizobium rosettiformans]|uniref:Type II toxin-antitoxin system HipA family toxin n=1 Tax=Rhizobium rosettiformans TaxID=1368430 RepID=A0ABX7F2Q9_9HYPH|nr:type II toxin-antitoxin system HipA family toxin [Rhizobium rosettiformans]QRF54485.1 type II toxin-antitoxin system HipA family toxin [Rhizobium rosettiformans]